MSYPFHILFLLNSKLTIFEQILLRYYNSSVERDGTTNQIVALGATACITGGLKANYSVSAPKVMYYSARGPDPEDNSFTNADILKPNLVAPGNSIWSAWSSLGTDSVEFQGLFDFYVIKRNATVVATWSPSARFIDGNLFFAC